MIRMAAQNYNLTKQSAAEIVTHTTTKAAIAEAMIGGIMLATIIGVITIVVTSTRLRLSIVDLFTITATTIATLTMAELPPSSAVALLPVL